ncbi:hypothetical protein Ancab_039110 [Ancistrocladus abbreviatus]
MAPQYPPEIVEKQGIFPTMGKGSIDRKTQAGNLIFPRISLRELDGGHVVLGLGHVDRTRGEATGPGSSSRQYDFRRAEGGNECLGRGNHLKPKTKKMGVSNCGLGCSRNSGELIKTSDGAPTSSEFSEIHKEESGNASTLWKTAGKRRVDIVKGNIDNGHLRQIGSCADRVLCSRMIMDN